MVERTPGNQDNEAISRQEAYRRCITAARGLAFSMTAEELRARPTHRTTYAPHMYYMEMLANVEGKTRGVAAQKEWAQRFEELGSQDRAARFYVQAAHAGDRDSATKVTELLEEESEELIQTSIEQGTYSSMGDRMLKVLDTCSELNMPVDEWIEEYGIGSAEHVATRKIEYIFHQKMVDQDKPPTDNAPRVGDRYLDEVTTAFLSEKQFSRSFAVKHAQILYHLNGEQAKKDEIFLHTAQMVGGQEMTFDTYRDLLRLGERILDNPDALAEEHIEWIGGALLGGIDNFIEAGVDPYEVNEATIELKIKLARAIGTPGDVLDFIGRHTNAQLGIDMRDTSDGRDEDEQIALERNTFLANLAHSYADQGDVAIAKLFTEQITDITLKSSMERVLLRQVTTVEDLTMFSPDDVELMMDPTIGDAYNERKILLERDPEKIKNLVDQKIAVLSDSLEIDDQMMDLDEYLDTLHRIAPQEAIISGRSVVQKLEEIDAGPQYIDGCLQENVKRGDEEALQTFFANVARFENDADALRAYTVMASLTAPGGEIDRSVEAHITAVEVHAYVEPDSNGAFVIEPEWDQIQATDEHVDGSIVTFPTSEGQIPLFPEEQSNDTEQRDEGDRDR
jgi:hypothetical protein